MLLSPKQNLLLNGYCFNASVVDRRRFAGRPLSLYCFPFNAEKFWNSEKDSPCATKNTNPPAMVDAGLLFGELGSGFSDRLIFGGVFGPTNLHHVMDTQ